MDWQRFYKLIDWSKITVEKNQIFLVGLYYQVASNPESLQLSVLKKLEGVKRDELLGSSSFIKYPKIATDHTQSTIVRYNIVDKIIDINNNLILVTLMETLVEPESLKPFSFKV